MMDGIMHNLARKQRLKAEQSQRKRPREQSPVSPRPDEVIASDGSPEKAMADYFPLPAAQLHPKGILKPPTVHFPEELGPPEDDNIASRLSSPLPPSETPSQTMNHVISNILPMSPQYPPPFPPPTAFPAPPPPPPRDAPQPPTLFNREIEANEYLNEAAYKLYTKFIDELSEFVDQQREVIRMRLQVQERRTQLKRLRESVSQCDVLLINYIRECITGGIPSDDGPLISLFEASQAARDLVGPKESEYEPMEVALGAEEHKLEEKYSSIENKFEHFFRLNATSTTKQSIPSKIEYEPTASSTSGGGRGWPTLEPREAGLLYGTIIGEQVNIGQEPLRLESGYRETALGQEISEKRKLDLSTDTADHSKKHRSNPTIDDRDYSKKHRSNATMDDQPEGETPADLIGIVGAQEPDLTHSQAFETRDRRISQSLKGLASHTLFESLDEPKPFPDDIYLDPGLQEGDLLLLLEEQCDTQSIFSDYLISFESTRDRVNRWLLHQLRISPREIYALRRQILDQTPGFQDWATLALSEWPNDMLGSSQSYHQGSIEDESDGPVLVSHPSEPYPSVEPLPETIILREKPEPASVYIGMSSVPALSERNVERFIRQRNSSGAKLEFEGYAGHIIA